MAAPRLSKLADVKGPARLPAYKPQDHGAGIVHLGIGAFHRAHQAVMTDDALAAEGGDWRIVGVSLRSRDIAEALNPQNGLYTLIERGPAGTSGRIIGAIEKVIAADPQATLDALCDPAIRVVTITVTEKGYGIDRRTGAPDPAHPAVAHDLQNPETPSGVLGLLTAALARRESAGVAPFTVLSCDNLPENGKLLRAGVTGFARLVDAAAADWIAANVAFPCSMVDRITPAATDETLAEAERLTGCRDLAAIETEPFLQWVIEDTFPQGRPAWEAGGALFVEDVAPYERMKLTMLNGSHSMLAYCGFLSGHRYVRDVMGDAALSSLVLRQLAAAAAEMEPLPGVDFADYAAALAERFRNPAIAHETYQIAMDGTQKIPQRLFVPAITAIEAGRDIAAFAFATAAWMRYALGRADDGSTYALRDPRETEIAEAIAGKQGAAEIFDTLIALPGFAPDALKADAGFRAATVERLARMLDNGMRAAIDAEAKLIHHAN